MKTKELELKIAELQRRIELMEQREANAKETRIVIQPAPVWPIPWITYSGSPFQPYVGPTCISDATGVCGATTTSDFSRAHCTTFSS